jgi:hypothetical protein
MNLRTRIEKVEHSIRRSQELLTVIVQPDESEQAVIASACASRGITLEDIGCLYIAHIPRRMPCT